jgi:hypothetical protein
VDELQLGLPGGDSRGHAYVATQRGVSAAIYVRRQLSAVWTQAVDSEPDRAHKSDK